MNMKELLPIIFSNIYGYDMIIFVAALINLFVYFFTMSRARRLYDVMHPTAKAHNTMQEAKIVDMRKATTSAYTTYINITAIFPLDICYRKMNCFLGVRLKKTFCFRWKSVGRTHPKTIRAPLRLRKNTGLRNF